MLVLKKYFLAVMGCTVFGCAAVSAAPYDPDFNHATITVPGRAIVKVLDPDQFGGFILTVDLGKASLPVRASHCTKGHFLDLEVADAGDKVAGFLESGPQFDRNKAFHDEIRSAQRTGEAVRIHLKGNGTYLKLSGNTVVLPYCDVSVDTSAP